MKLRIAFPKRGSPPPCPEGYEQEAGDPFVFTLKWRPCVFHGIQDGNHTCVMYLKVINQNICKECNTCVDPTSCQLSEGDGRQLPRI